MDVVESVLIDMDVVEFVGLFLAGILAGEEFVIRYGVHPSLAVLDEQAQIRARQGLIRRMRILVPTIFVPTVITAVVILVLGGSGFWWAGAASLLAFLLVTFIGTVPINQDIGKWQADAPPGNWRTVIRRWERIDIARSSAAILTFAFFLTAITR